MKSPPLVSFHLLFGGSFLFHLGSILLILIARLTVCAETYDRALNDFFNDKEIDRLFNEFDNLDQNISLSNSFELDDDENDNSNENNSGPVVKNSEVDTFVTNQPGSRNVFYKPPQQSAKPETTQSPAQQISTTESSVRNCLIPPANVWPILWRFNFGLSSGFDPSSLMANSLDTPTSTSTATPTTTASSTTTTTSSATTTDKQSLAELQSQSRSAECVDCFRSSPESDATFKPDLSPTSYQNSWQLFRRIPLLLVAAAAASSTSSAPSSDSDLNSFKSRQFGRSKRAVSSSIPWEHYAAFDTDSGLSSLANSLNLNYGSGLSSGGGGGRYSSFSNNRDNGDGNFGGGGGGGGSGGGGGGYSNGRGGGGGGYNGGNDNNGNGNGNGNSNLLNSFITSGGMGGGGGGRNGIGGGGIGGGGNGGGGFQNPFQTNSPRVDFGGGGHHQLISGFPGHLNGHTPVYLVSKNSPFSHWMFPVLFLLATPFLLGAAFIPLFLKSLVYLLQIGRNLGILFPLIPPVINGTNVG